MKRSNNIVAEYGEYLAAKYYKTKPLPISHPSADFEKNGNLYQVKTRRVDKNKNTSLGIIRSWEFDFLVVIIFDLEGVVIRAIEIPVVIAKKYAKENNHQNGWVISTSHEFMNNKKAKDIQKDISLLNKI